MVAECAPLVHDVVSRATEVTVRVAPQLRATVLDGRSGVKRSVEAVVVAPVDPRGGRVREVAPAVVEPLARLEVAGRILQIEDGDTAVRGAQAASFHRPLSSRRDVDCAAPGVAVSVGCIQLHDGRRRSSRWRGRGRQRRRWAGAHGEVNTQEGRRRRRWWQRRWVRPDRRAGTAARTHCVRAIALDDQHVAARLQARLHDMPRLAAVARPVGLPSRELGAGDVVVDAKGPRGTAAAAQGELDVKVGRRRRRRWR